MAKNETKQLFAALNGIKKTNAPAFTIQFARHCAKTSFKTSQNVRLDR
jgi:hypothetical protein